MKAEIAILIGLEIAAIQVSVIFWMIPFLLVRNVIVIVDIIDTT